MEQNVREIDMTPHSGEIDIDQKSYEVIMEARSRCTLTEQQIADAAGVSRPTVTKYLNGTQKAPQFRTVMRIWRGMGYEDDEFYRLVFPPHGPIDMSGTADRIGSDFGADAEIDYLKRDIVRLLGIIQDRQQENFYHKKEIVQMMDEHDSALTKIETNYQRLIEEKDTNFQHLIDEKDSNYQHLIAEKERSNHRLFIATWVVFGILVALLGGVITLIIHDFGDPNSGWFRVAGQIAQYSRSVWNM